MLGAIIGDIIGSVYEFDNIKTKHFPLFSRGCSPTDDSVMTIAVADAVMSSWGRDDEAVKEALVKSMQTYGRKYPHAGYGGSFRQWLRKKNPAPYGSYGNGSAMRVSSAAWLFDNVADVMHMAKLTAEVTHNHEEGIRGAVSLAAAIFFARARCDKDDIRMYIEKTFGYDLSFSLDEIRPDYSFDESCQGTVPYAMRAFLEGNSYEEVVRLAVSIGGDSDTIACIAGALAEGYYGIPEEIRNQGLGYLDSFLLGKVKEFRRFYRAHSGRPDLSWKDRIRFLIKSPYTTGCPALESAISKWYEKEQKEGADEILNTLLGQALADTEVIVPIDLVDDSGADDGSVFIRHLIGEDGAFRIPVFTSKDEIDRGEATSMAPFLLRDMIEMAALSDDFAGLVINAFGQAVWLDKELLTELFIAIREFLPERP